jgi:hypothetical protein
MVSSESTPDVAPHSPTGPYLTMAVLCQHALVEKDDVLSVIRIVDRLVTPPSIGPYATISMPVAAGEALRRPPGARRAPQVGPGGDRPSAQDAIGRRSARLLAR